MPIYSVCTSIHASFIITKHYQTFFAISKGNNLERFSLGKTTAY